MSALNDFLWSHTCLNNSRRFHAAIAEWKAALDESDRDRAALRRILAGQINEATGLREELRVMKARADRARRHAAGLKAQVAAQAGLISKLERDLAVARTAAE